MSAIHNEGAKEGDDAIRVLTADGLEVVMDMTVLYKVVPSSAPDILRSTGVDYTDKIVRPLTRTKIRDNAVYYDAVSLYSTKRDEFQDRIFKSIEADFKIRGLLLEQLLIRNITLPQAVRTSIEQKISAEQDAQKMQFVLQKERQEAERKRVEAQGIADYQHIISESLTDRQLQYESIKAQLEVAKSANAKVVIMGKARRSLDPGYKIMIQELFFFFRNRGNQFPIPHPVRHQTGPGFHRLKRSPVTHIKCMICAGNDMRFYRNF